MKKSLILLLLAFSAMSSYAYDVCIDGIYYNLVSKAKQATVTNNGSEWGDYSGDVEIPSTVEYAGVTYNVTSIANNAFQNCSSLTSVQIPNTVTSIGDSAFDSTNLSSIQIPNSVTSIGERAFADCTSLSAITIPNFVTSISSGTFQYCTNLSSITIPNSVTSIGGDAFFFCKSLSTITIPNSVTSIGMSAFHSCSSLSSITIPNSVTRIESNTFQNCTSLASINLPGTLDVIDARAFYGCESLTSVDIPNGVVTIGENAFYGCANITDVKIGNSIAYIANGAFANCQKLENVYCYKIFGGGPDNYFSTDPTAFDGSYIEYANLFVPAESLGEYSATAPWSNFGTKSALTPTAPEDIDLVDGVDYTNNTEKTCKTLTYTRNFTDTNWNALYVPFAMDYADWSADFEVARLNDVHQFDDDEDGVVDRTVLESVKLKAGSKTEPNTPYLIKAKATGNKTISLTNTTLYAAKENRFDVTSWYTRFNFTGTYHTVTDMATAGYYAMADGGLKQASSDAVTLGAFRWYLDVTDRNGNPAPIAAKKILLSFDDGETTEIEVVNAESQSGSDVYTISGVKVSNDKNALPKGIYIMNGKKVIIK